jgi:hypothetical protein
MYPSARALENLCVPALMPYHIIARGHSYSVIGPHGIKARRTSRRKAKRQIRLLLAVEHGWHPTWHRKSVFTNK